MLYKTTVACRRCAQPLGYAHADSSHTPACYSFQTPHLACGRPLLHSLGGDRDSRCKALLQEILLACQLGSSNRLLVTVDAKLAQSFFVLLWIIHADTLVISAIQ